MLNYATKLNEPWDGIEDLFVDSGGYSFMLGKGEYGTSAAEYVEFLIDAAPTLWALRDYPCEQDVLDAHGRTVADHQELTLNAHRRVWDVADNRDVPGQRVSVLQGRTVGEYLDHLDTLRDHGVLADYVGIGSVCGRENIAEVRRIVTSVADEIPHRDLHGFGVKRSALLEFNDVTASLTSADSMAYTFAARYAAFKDNRPTDWREVAYQYLQLKRRVAAVNANDRPPAELREDGQLALGEVVD